MSHEPFVPNSFEIWPYVFDKILECFLLLDKATIFLHKVEIFEQVWKRIDNPVNIGEIPPSGLGGSYYWRTTEGRMSSWQDGHPMTTTWVKKGIHHSKIYESCWKAESTSPLAIYKPHPEKILFEPVHEISNNMVCATSKTSDQPAHTRSLIRAFASPLSILWLLSYCLNTIWSF